MTGPELPELWYAHSLRMRRLVGLSTLTAVLLSGASSSAQPRRIVAIGDIHGAFDEFVAIMQAAGLLDQARRWSGGNATFVQTGDYTDRGAGVRPVMDLLMEIESQASKGGGRAIVLLGNHELMNLVGEQRDVTPEIYATFADSESESRRERAWAQYEELAAARAKARPVVPEVYKQAKETWLAAHPPGWLEYRDALSPRGRYGKWLRDKRVSARVDGTLFMHAGPDPLGTALDIDAIDAQIRQEIARMDRYVERAVAMKLALPFFTLQELLEVGAGEIRGVNAAMAASKESGEAPDLRGFDIDFVKQAAEMVSIGEWHVLNPNGPMWYRGYAAAPEATLREPVVNLFAKNDLSRIVVGHTPSTERRILTRLGGAVVLIDSGMLTSAYKGRASALEIAGNQLTAIYGDGRVPLETTKPSPVEALVLQHQGE
jgi:Calcineurin-like phosphoesterase